MNNRVVWIFLGIVALLLGANSYFFVQNSALRQQVSRLVQKNASPEPLAAPSALTPDEVSALTTPTAQATLSTQTLGTKVSTPSKTYTVQKGETLYPIGLKFEINWEALALINGLENPDAIGTGDVLVIPAKDDKTKKFRVDFTIDAAKATQFQEEADRGLRLERLNPIEVVRSDGPPLFKLSVETKMSLIDSTPDSAQVLAITPDGEYIATLVQPAKKGEGGIWALVGLAQK